MIWVPRVEPVRPTETVLRALEIALGLENQSKVPVSTGMLRAKVNRLSKALLCTAEITLGPEDAPNDYV